MPRRLRHLLPDSSFLRKWWLLASGTIMGQALVVISSPLLTRLVTPEDFGLFAVFSALVGIAGGAAGLRYEYAVPLAAADEDAAAIAAVVVLTSAGLAALAAGLVWLCGGWFVERLDAALLGPWLWLLPPAIFVWGSGSALNYWSVRRGTYGVNAINRTLQLGAQTAGQLGTGFAGWGAPGLIIGYLFGYLTRLGNGDRRLVDIQLHIDAIPHLDSPPFLRLGTSPSGATLERRMSRERPPPSYGPIMEFKTSIQRTLPIRLTPIPARSSVGHGCLGS